MNKYLKNKNFTQNLPCLVPLHCKAKTAIKKIEPTLVLHKDQNILSDNNRKLTMTPIILKKILNDKAKIIPLNTHNNLGYIPHYPPATQEWSSSIYAYFKNNDIKSIPLLDKILIKLMKSFLNFYHQSERFKSEYKPIHIRLRRLSLKKNFVNKADLKHTNSKVIINIHVYNIQKKLLMEEIDRINKVIYPRFETDKLNKNYKILLKKKPWLKKIVKWEFYYSHPNFYEKINTIWANTTYTFDLLIKLVEKEISLIIKNKKSINKEDIPYFFYLMKVRLIEAYFNKDIEEEKFLSSMDSLNNKSINQWGFPSILSLVDDIEKEKLILNKITTQKRYNIEKNKVIIGNIRKRELKLKKEEILNKIWTQSDYNINLSDVLHTIPLFYSIAEGVRENIENCESLYKNFWLKRVKNELELIRYYKFLLDLYDNKFKCLIPKLKKLITKMYKKEIEFNFVSLKHMYLNSNIMTQAIVLRLKVRKNSLLRVLNSCLNMVKLPKNNIYQKKTDKYSHNFTPTIIEDISKLPSISIINDFFFKDCLKYKWIGGVRLEAKGRLTKRFTASRSLFKLKWKGSLQNTESSHLGLSAVILRGHVKSNLQYSAISSNTRVGAYGVKSWVSGK